jgi:hypothetical protein
MKKIYKKDAKKFVNGKNCVVFEYPIDDKINGAAIEISGRFPENGKLMNLECKEMIYILDGSGKIFIEDKEINLEKKCIILIEPKEKYFWQGNFKAFFSCTPAWYPEQSKKVE